MKLLITFLCVVTLVIDTTAQQDTINHHLDRKFEIGYTQGFPSNRYYHTYFQGIQFKKWKNEHLGVRVLAGLVQLTNNNFKPVLARIADTIYHKMPIMRLITTTVGLGLEYRQQLYKRVYCFAAAELKAGYGRGSVDTMIERYDTRQLTSGRTPARGVNFWKESTSWYAGFTPNVGINLIFNRITLGTGLAWNLISFYSVSYKNAPGSSTVMTGLVNFSPRIFIHYRF